MTRNNRLTVTIRSAPDDSETFVAMFESPVLSSTFCLEYMKLWGNPEARLSFCKGRPGFVNHMSVWDFLIDARPLSAAAPLVWRGGLSSYRTGT